MGGNFTDVKAPFSHKTVLDQRPSLLFIFYFLNDRNLKDFLKRQSDLKASLFKRDAVFII